MTETKKDSATPRFEIHELIYCAKCYLPYDPEVNLTQIPLPPDAKQRKWYLPSCGHAVCQTCLFPNSPGTQSQTPTPILSQDGELCVDPPPLESDTRVPCPKCNSSASIVVLDNEVHNSVNGTDEVTARTVAVFSECDGLGRGSIGSN